MEFLKGQMRVKQEPGSIEDDLRVLRQQYVINILNLPICAANSHVACRNAAYIA